LAEATAGIARLLAMVFESEVRWRSAGELTNLAGMRAWFRSHTTSLATEEEYADAREEGDLGADAGPAVKRDYGMEKEIVMEGKGGGFGKVLIVDGLECAGDVAQRELEESMVMGVEGFGQFLGARVGSVPRFRVAHSLPLSLSLSTPPFACSSTSKQHTIPCPFRSLFHFLLATFLANLFPLPMTSRFLPMQGGKRAACMRLYHAGHAPGYSPRPCRSVSCSRPCAAGGTQCRSREAIVPRYSCHFLPGAPKRLQAKLPDAPQLPRQPLHPPCIHRSVGASIHQGACGAVPHKPRHGIASVCEGNPGTGACGQGPCLLLLRRAKHSKRL
jgi:hypothetical protein